MALLFGAAAHPHSGEILSTPYRKYRTVEERIAANVTALGPEAPPGGRDAGAGRAVPDRRPGPRGRA